MKKYMKIFVLLYLTGFVSGIVCCSLVFKENGYQTSLLPVYLSSSAFWVESRKRFFGSLLFRRGWLFLTGAVVGLTSFGLPFTVLCLLWSGFLAGNLIQVFLTEYGIKGMGMCGICMFPQILFYVPGWLFFFFLVTQMSQKTWKTGGKTKADDRAYLFFLTGAFLCILLGIWMESYVNQNIMELVLKKWNLFTKN